MFDVLKQLLDNDKQADFLIPGMQEIVQGKVTRLTTDLAVITFTEGTKSFEVIAHPNNLGVIQKT